jgi:hypothetical protein
VVAGGIAADAYLRGRREFGEAIVRNVTPRAA